MASETYEFAQWNDGTRYLYYATYNGVYDLCVFDASSLISELPCYIMLCEGLNFFSRLRHALRNVIRIKL